MTEQRRDIGSRLENWARVYRSTRTIGVSATGAFCDRLEREANGEKPTSDRRKVDEEDAHAIELAMRHISRRDRLMLRYCYIDQERPEAVCRKLSLAHRPATVFINAFHHAQAAIEAMFANNRARQREE